jgi:hypothetical protein
MDNPAAPQESERERILCRRVLAQINALTAPVRMENPPPDRMREALERIEVFAHLALYRPDGLRDQWPDLFTAPGSPPAAQEEREAPYGWVTPAHGHAPAIFTHERPTIYASALPVYLRAASQAQEVKRLREALRCRASSHMIHVAGFSPHTQALPCPYCIADEAKRQYAEALLASWSNSDAPPS